MEVTPEKWDQVRELFDVALCQEPTLRPSFLVACPEPEIRLLVERLLVAYDEAGSFLSHPPINIPHLAAMPAREAFAPGDLVSERFRIIRLIAKGGMGEVYEAEDCELQQRIAIKTIRPEVFEQPGVLEQFRREVVLARMIAHPNVCRIYELLRDENLEASGTGAIFLTMELLPGETLKSRLARDGRIEAGEAIPLIIQIAKGLAAAHALGILHRDLKPGNVVLVGSPPTEQVRAVITDFGMAINTTEALTADLAQQNHLRGTPAYMSPEQLEGRTLTPASDIYALGLMAYEMLTGTRPFAAPMASATKRLTEAVLPPRKIVPALPRSLERAILKCLERAPGDRFATVNEFIGALKDGSLRSRIKSRLALLALMIPILIGVSAMLASNFKDFLRPAPPTVLKYRQLTNDGINKAGPLWTDGANVYFSEYLRGKAVFAAVPIRGGEITYPSSVGLDFDASSNGGKLAYVDNGSRELYVSNSDKTQAHRIFFDSSGRIKYPRWSPDGKVLRFDLVKPGLGTAFDNSLWEILPDGSRPHSLIPEWNQITNAYSGNWTPDGRYYVFDSFQEGKVDIWAVREESSFFLKRGQVPERITTAPLDFFYPLPGTDGKAVFALGKRKFAELVRYDTRTKSFVPYLGGISAGSANFSHDDAWVAYVKHPEGTLWRSKIDGSEKLQLTYPPFTADSPHWSPDGKQIAVRLVNPTVPDDPNKVYLVSQDGGTPEVLLPGDSKLEGVPTWSPDGESLLFGGLPNGPNRFPLHIVNIKNKIVSEVPDSQGLWTPRWSLDGRYIAALSGDSQTLMLFDFRTQKWRPLLEHVPNLNEPCWSHDGRFVYVDSTEREPAVYRVRISDSKTEHLVSLTGFRRAYGQSFGTWLGLTPQDEILLIRDVGEPEVYALDMAW